VKVCKRPDGSRRDDFPSFVGTEWPALKQVRYIIIATMNGRYNNEWLKEKLQLTKWFALLSRLRKLPQLHVVVLTNQPLGLKNNNSGCPASQLLETFVSESFLFFFVYCCSTSINYRKFFSRRREGSFCETSLKEEKRQQEHEWLATTKKVRQRKDEE